MNRRKQITLSLTVAGMFAVIVNSAFALDGLSKRGCAYYERVCTSCHVEMTGKEIPLDTRTMQEWREYMAKDKHDATGRSNPSIRYYISRDYRQSIKDTNKLASKLEDYPDEDLYICVTRFMLLAARDADVALSREGPN